MKKNKENIIIKPLLINYVDFEKWLKANDINITISYVGNGYWHGWQATSDDIMWHNPETWWGRFKNKKKIYSYDVHWYYALKKYVYILEGKTCYIKVKNKWTKIKIPDHLMIYEKSIKKKYKQGTGTIAKEIEV